MYNNATILIYDIPYSMKCLRQKTNFKKIYAGFSFCAKSFPQKLIPRENFNTYY